MVTMAAGVVTHTGLIRTVNEDSVLRADRFVAVADGMGGHAAGERASRMAIAEVAALARKSAARPDDVVAAIANANAKILGAGADDPQLAGMGTTLSGVGIVHVGGTEHWIIFNVGDSRVYRYAGGVLTQVTVDHSEAEELRAAGRLTGDEARSYSRRNVITRSLGTLPPPEPDLWVLPPVSGERFLVCSDGLTSDVTDGEIADVLAAHLDAQDAAETLVARALSAGGHDNVSAIVVRLETIPPGIEVDGDTVPRIRDAQGR